MKSLTTRVTYSKAFIIAAGLCVSFCLAANRAKAATSLYFDSNGTAAGYGSGGSWDGNNWATATGGTTATGAWGPGDFARFNTAASSIVTVGADESMAGLFNTISAATVTINQSSSSGQLDITTAGGAAVSGGLVQGFLCTGPVIINAPIVGSGGIQPQLGTLSLFTNNTYSGGTYLGSSLVNFNNNNSFGSGPITPGTTSGTQTSPAYAGLLSSGGNLITLPNNFVITNAFSGINFGSSANTPVTCSGNWNLQQTLYVKNNGNPTAPLTLSGVLSGSGGLNVSGNNLGTIILSGANTFTGPTTLGQIGASSNITVSVSSINSVSGGAASGSLGAPTTVANGTINMGSLTNAGILIYTGVGETSDRVINLTGTTGGGTIENDGSGPLVFTSNLTATTNGAKALTLQGSNTGANTFSGAIVNSGSGATSVTKGQAGTWVLSGANTYSGATAIQNGTLSASSLNKVTGGAASSSLGAPTTVANGTIAIGATTTTGKLVYTGVGETSDRVINLAGTTGGATVENDGSGAVVFSSACTATGNGAKTLTLQGSYTATANSIGAIPNGASSSKTSVTVAGGHWTITGASGYTGITAINAGTLTLANTISSPTIIVAGGATFDLTGLLPTILTLSSQTVSNSSSTAVLNGSLNLGTATASLTYASGTPSFMVANGTLTLANNSVIKVNNTGSALTHGSYKIISAGTGGSVAFGSTAPAVTVSGGGIMAGATASLTIVSGELYLVVDQAPTITNPVVTENATAGSVWKISITSLASAAGWGDPDGDTVTLSGVGPSSFNGTNVTSDANYIYYNGPVTVADNFGYTITDGTLTASGTVDLVPVNVPSPNIVSPNINGSGNPTFSGYGIPGYVYGVESETNLTGPWVEAGPVTAASSDGSWSFTDLTQTNSTTFTTIYYRLYYPDDPSNPPQ